MAGCGEFFFWRKVEPAAWNTLQKFEKILYQNALVYDLWDIVDLVVVLLLYVSLININVVYMEW